MVRSWSEGAREAGAPGARRRLDSRIAVLLASTALPGVILIGELTINPTPAAADGGAGGSALGDAPGGKDNATSPGAAGANGGGGGAGFPSGGAGGGGGRRRSWLCGRHI